MTAACDPVCDTCDGFGFCPECDGRGVVFSADDDDLGDGCDDCAGTGRCPDCEGTGEQP